ncbi:MAG TPA: glycosyltransferase [Terriglobales bacterium]|nr:glycosyltransferase [Terriglobales bacterium]
MKILWVKAGGLVPPDTGGKIRSYHILRELACDHSITFFSFYGAHTNDSHSQLQELFESVITVPLDLPEPKSFRELRDYISRLFTRKPYNISKYCHLNVRHELRQLLERESFDAIVCDFVIAAGVIPWEGPTPKVLFTHNVESVIWQRHYQVAGNPLWKALSWREWRTMQAAEREYLQKADRILTVSEDDRRYFARFIDATKLSVIPTGVDTDFFSPVQKTETPNNLVFTGSMDWLPNEDGAIYFIKEILPLIRREVPESSLTIVGRNPSRKLRDLAAATANVHLTGWVEDIRPYLSQASVCVVPLRIGGGTRLKIFEAMSMGRAIVSTTIGAEGLPVRPDEHLVIADAPAQFAKRTLELLRDPERRRSMGVTARQLVVKNYGWGIAAKQFADILAEVVAESGRSRRSERTE